MLTYIQPFDEVDSFPPLDKALEEPNGLLAMGGDLSVNRLLAAYRRGIFPWYSLGEPILWWSPNPRMVLFPSEFHASRSLKKSMKKQHFAFTFNQAFNDVIHACAAPRSTTSQTWITAEMKQAYSQLHQLGYAHSLEVWQNDQLVGGLYGIAIGRVFFGESMFSTTDNASKAAFWILSQKLEAMQFAVIDCQVYSEHLETLGARQIDRTDFKKILHQHCNDISKAKLMQKEPLAVDEFLWLGPVNTI